MNSLSTASDPIRRRTRGSIHITLCRKIVILVPTPVLRVLRTIEYLSHKAHASYLYGVP
jgi:hypothetical protein